MKVHWDFIFFIIITYYLQQDDSQQKKKFQQDVHGLNLLSSLIIRLLFVRHYSKYVTVFIFP